MNKIILIRRRCRRIDRMAIAAAINAMATDHQPLARQANNQAFMPPMAFRQSPYNMEYGRDHEKF
jgi:hypothetical protein